MTDSEIVKLSKQVVRLTRRLKKLKAEHEKTTYELATHTSAGAWSWTQHRLVGNDGKDDGLGLPVPRLQIEMIALDKDGYSTAFRYDLIYRHYGDDLLYAVPIGYTRSSGGFGRWQVQDIDEPFRDGFHIRADAEQLGLPAFRVRGEKAERLSTLAQFKADGTRLATQPYPEPKP